MKIYYVVVVYNKNCRNSITVQQLIKFKCSQIIVLDNSTINNNNDLFCEKNNITYYSMGGNVGLSKAYNFIIEKLKKEKGFIVWFDDDTLISESYINDIKKYILEYDVIIPKIRCNNVQISPLKRFGIKYFATQKICNRKIYAINSCLAVNLKIYNDGLKYDENLFLDNVDLDFFEKLNQKKYNIKIIESNIKQNLFLITNNNIELFKKRYSIYLKDNYIFYKNSLINIELLSLKVLYNSLKYSLKYKSVSLFWFINNEFKNILDKEK